MFHFSGVDLEPQPPLPGGGGAVGQTETRESDKDRLDRSDLLTRFTNRERQAQALYSAADYLHNTSGADEEACTGTVMATFPDIQGMDQLECKLQASEITTRVWFTSPQHTFYMEIHSAYYYRPHDAESVTIQFLVLQSCANQMRGEMNSKCFPQLSQLF